RLEIEIEPVQFAGDFVGQPVPMHLGMNQLAKHPEIVPGQRVKGGDIGIRPGVKIEHHDSTSSLISGGSGGSGGGSWPALSIGGRKRGGSPRSSNACRRSASLQASAWRRFPRLAVRPIPCFSSNGKRSRRARGSPLTN